MPAFSRFTAVQPVEGQGGGAIGRSTPFLCVHPLPGRLRLCYKTAGGVDGTILMDYDNARLVEKMFPNTVI